MIAGSRRTRPSSGTDARENPSRTRSAWRSEATWLTIAPATSKAFRQPRAAFRHSRRRLREALRADDEHHRQSGQRRERGGRAGAARAAVEEAHHAFDDDDVRALRLPREPRRDRAPAASPRDRD